MQKNRVFGRLVILIEGLSFVPVMAAIENNWVLYFVLSGLLLLTFKYFQELNLIAGLNNFVKLILISGAVIGALYNFFPSWQVFFTLGWVIWCFVHPLKLAIKIHRTIDKGA